MELCGWQCGAAPAACPGGCSGKTNIYKIATLPTTTTTAGALVTSRRVTLDELEGELKPGGGRGWTPPLTHHEDDSNNISNPDGHACTWSASASSPENPGHWSVRFKDLKKRRVSMIRLWNREGYFPFRLSNACVRFSLDGSVPPNADQNQNCDDYLPAVVRSDSGPGSGTWVVIDRWIVGMSIVSTANFFGGHPPVVQLCGIEIYEETTTRLCTREDFVGEQGPGVQYPGSSTWWKPLTHHEDDSNEWPGKCSHTKYSFTYDLGYWFAQFKDGKRHKVKKVRLWNRVGYNSRLDGACVRFATDGSKPSNADPSENCDDYLPDISSTSSHRKHCESPWTGTTKNGAHKKAEF
eukprot:g14517.t1